MWLHQRQGKTLSARIQIVFPAELSFRLLKKAGKEIPIGPLKAYSGQRTASMFGELCGLQYHFHLA
jgi:hypothetical protein